MVETNDLDLTLREKMEVALYRLSHKRTFFSNYQILRAELRQLQSQMGAQKDRKITRVRYILVLQNNYLFETKKTTEIVKKQKDKTGHISNFIKAQCLGWITDASIRRVQRNAYQMRPYYTYGFAPLNHVLENRVLW